MGPAVEGGRLKAELHAFVRTKEQLENAILANEGSRHGSLSEAQTSSRQLDQSSSAEPVGITLSDHEVSKPTHQRKTSGGFTMFEPSSTDSSEASRGDIMENNFNQVEGREPAGTGVLPGNVDRDGPADAAARKVEQEGRRPIGPPSYVASTKGSWGSYLVTTSPGADGLGAGHAPGGRSTSGPSAQVAGGDGEKAGGNVLTHWFTKQTTKQKAAGRLAKATAKEEAAPKMKHMTKLVEFARHNGTDAASMLAMLAKRPILTDKVVALKGLLLIHQLMQRGSLDALPACYSQLSLLQDIGKAYGRSAPAGTAAAGPDSYRSLICAYSCMLTEKVKFHHRFVAYEGNYSVDLRAYASKAVNGKGGDKPGDPLTLEALSGLQSIFDRTLECITACMAQLRRKTGSHSGSLNKQGVSAAGATTGQKEVDPEGLLLSVVIPILVEAELVHSICCYTLEILALAGTRLHVPAKGLSAAKEQLARQHRSLRTAFEEARNDSSLSAKSIRPPVLPEEPSCLAPPPLISTSSIPRNWLWPDEAGEQPAAEVRVVADEKQGGRLAPAEKLWQAETSKAAHGDKGKEGAGALSIQTSKPVIGGVGAAMDAALQRHAAGLEGQPRHHRGSGEPGSPAGSQDFDTMASSARSSRAGSPQQVQYSPGTGGACQVSPFGASPLGQSGGQGIEPPPLAMPLPQAPTGPGAGMVVWPAALPSPAMSPRPTMVVPQPPPPPHPMLVHQQLHQMHLHNLQLQEEGKRYLRQQQEQQQILQQREWQQQQAQQQAVAALEQARFADLLANSPYKPGFVKAGLPLNQVGWNPAFPPPPEAWDRPQGTLEQQQGLGRQGGNELTANATKRDPLNSWHMGSMSDTSAWDPTNGATPRQSRASSAAGLPEWEISYSELKLGQKIGQGAFGDVVKGSWQGTEVAVKRLQNMAAAQYVQASSDFRREVELVMKLRHPNVILFMGACTADEHAELCIVMEYAKNGSLYHVLRDPLLKMDMSLVVRWALEAAKGMNYLHTRSPPIVHRDLKSVNLLVDADWHLKVSDFGLARTKASSYAHSQVGTWGWMAPEVLDKQPYDEKADVYSFGVVLWELITRDEPFKGLHPMQIIRAVDKGERPPLPPSCPGPFRQLIVDCWQNDAHRRPSFEQIIRRLSAMDLALKQQQQQQQQSQQPGTAMYAVR